MAKQKFFIYSDETSKAFLVLTTISACWFKLFTFNINSIKFNKTPKLDFLDETGKITYSLPEAVKADQKIMSR